MHSLSLFGGYPGHFRYHWFGVRAASGFFEGRREISLPFSWVKLLTNLGFRSLPMRQQQEEWVLLSVSGAVSFVCRVILNRRTRWCCLCRGEIHQCRHQLVKPEKVHMRKETEVDASVRKDKCKKRLQGEPLLWVRSFPKIYGQDIT